MLCGPVSLWGFGGMLPRKKILYILRLNASIWCTLRAQNEELQPASTHEEKALTCT